MGSCLITFQSSALTWPPAPRSTTLCSPAWRTPREGLPGMSSASVCRPGQGSGSARGPPARGSARRISHSWHPAGLPCGHSSRRRSALMSKWSMNHACDPGTTRAITAPSCVTPTAATSKPFAAPPDSDRRRACRHLPLPTTVRLLQVGVGPERGWRLLRRRSGDGRSGGMTRRSFPRGNRDRLLRRSP
jgi:hypothetical protein